MQKILYGNVPERGFEIMEALDFLKSNININSPLLTVVDKFSSMCRIEINSEDDMFLFEAGPVTHKNKSMLLLSMVRQFSDGNDEPTQIHTDIIYNVDVNIRKLSACSWHENCGDFIQTVLLSKAFETCKNLRIEKIDIWVDET